MKEMICIVCPRGCHINIDESTLTVQGNSCEKGCEYAKNEIVAPKRTVTGSVGISGGIHPRLAVRTDRAVPKEKMFEIMAALHAFTANSPVKRGEILIEDVCGTGANVISSRDM
jgi:CxxC motif-containing protein